MRNITIYRHNHLIFLILMASTGCAVREPSSPSQSYNNPQQREISPRSDCYESYRVTIQECDSFLSQQVDPAIKYKQTIKCLSNKGFSKGADSCQ